MTLRIIVDYWARTRLVRPIHIRILPQEMIVFVGIHYECDLRHVGRATILEPAHLYIRIISQDTCHHIGTCLEMFGVEGGVS